MHREPPEGRDTQTVWTCGSRLQANSMWVTGSVVADGNGSDSGNSLVSSDLTSSASLLFPLHTLLSNNRLCLL